MAGTGAGAVDEVRYPSMAISELDRAATPTGEVPPPTPPGAVELAGAPGSTVGYWEGDLCVEGEWTGDDRIFDPGALYWENLPAPLRWAEYDHGGHDGARHVGWITDIARMEGNRIWGKGTVFDSEFNDFFNRAGQLGVSIDPDSFDMTVVIPQDQPPLDGGVYHVPAEPQVFHRARLRAATAVDIPAVIGAVIRPTSGDTILASDSPGLESLVTHSGIAVVALDTGRFLLQQRALDEEDPAQGLWEFPGGGLDEGESPEQGALREFAEETGLALPEGTVCAQEWTSPSGIYMGHVYPVAAEADLKLNPDDERVALANPDDPERVAPEPHAWFTMDTLPPLRQEFDTFDWSVLTMADDPTFAAEGLELMPPEAPEEAPQDLGEADIAFLDSILTHHQEITDEAISFLDANPDSALLPFVSEMLEHVGEGTAEIQGLLGAGEEPTEEDALVASAAPVAPPDEWFEGFDLDGPTPLTVTADGRVFGHLATWGQCHVDASVNGQCVAPPSDPAAPIFQLGEVITASGQALEVGRVTVGGGHAPKGLKMRATLDHYDDVATCAAVVKVVEDDFGIGLFGSVVPEATPEQVAALRRSPLSGDWRKERGRWRLTAAHAVNTPAFPIPRNGDMALVASSTPESFITTGRVARRYADGMDVDLEPLRQRLVASVHANARELLADRITG